MDWDMAVIYKDNRNGGYFVSPDGVGRFHYDTLEAAKEQHFDLPVVEYLDEAD